MGKSGSNPYNLEDRQWEFVKEYLVDFNGARAYQRAGYKATGNVAEAAASRLLRSVKIRLALQGESKRILNEYDITPEKVIQEYARLGFSDIRRYASWGPNGVRLHPSEQLDDNAAAAVSEVSEETRTFGESEVRTVKFKLHSKTDGLSGLAKYLDLFGEAKALGAIGQGLASLLEKKADDS